MPAAAAVPSAGEVIILKDEVLTSADLAIDSNFASSSSSWHRPLCLRGLTSAGRTVTFGDFSVVGERCVGDLGDGGGHVIASWKASANPSDPPVLLAPLRSRARAQSLAALTDQAESAAAMPTPAGAASSCADANMEEHVGQGRIGAALAAWQALEPSFEDPDCITTASEYFPLNLQPTTKAASFLKVNLRESDEIGNEIVVLRDTVTTTPVNAVHQEECRPCMAALYRPAVNLEHWFWSICPSFPSMRAWMSIPGPVQLMGVRVLEGHATTWTPRTTDAQCNHRPFNLEDLRRTIVRHAASTRSGDVSGFLPGTPWLNCWKVERVEEHCREANLGFWGWVFNLKHSVLAVHLRCAGGAQPSTTADANDASSDVEDILYLDKNADIGVSWRRAAAREHFPESPREDHSFSADMSVDTLWRAVSSTAAFSESQDRSNCQHFVRESLAEFAERGLIDVDRGRAFALRNQDVAEWLQKFGYLDDELKAPTGNTMGQQAWRMFMSWDSKLGITRLLTPWMHSFVLHPATTL